MSASLRLISRRRKACSVTFGNVAVVAVGRFRVSYDAVTGGGCHCLSLVVGGVSDACGAPLLHHCSVVVMCAAASLDRCVFPVLLSAAIVAVGPVQCHLCGCQQDLHIVT